MRKIPPNTQQWTNEVRREKTKLPFPLFIQTFFVFKFRFVVCCQLFNKDVVKFFLISKLCRWCYSSKKFDLMFQWRKGRGFQPLVVGDPQNRKKSRLEILLILWLLDICKSCDILWHISSRNTKYNVLIFMKT